MLDGLTAVWTPATIVAAILTGLLVGAFPIGFVISRSRYRLPTIGPGEYGVLVAILGTLVGIAFFVGQVYAAGAVDNDPLAYRIASRYALFLLFGPCMGLGTSLSLRSSLRARERNARNVASARIADRDDKAS